jgi:hypothetical protein
MRDLTPSEAALVATNRKPEADLPVIYDPVTNLSTPITREFETWLILTPIGTRSQISMWLSQLAQNTPHDEAFDNLATEFLEDEVAAARAEIEEYDSSLSGYDRFRNTLNTDGFSDVTELGTLLSLTTTGLGRISSARNSANYAGSMALYNQADLRSRRTDENTRRTLRSWVSVMLAYP